MKIISPKNKPFQEKINYNQKENTKSTKKHPRIKKKHKERRKQINIEKKKKN